VFLPDRNTQQMSYFVADQIEQELGFRPHIVLSNIRRCEQRAKKKPNNFHSSFLILDRSHLDPNRDIDQAAQGNAEAEDAYNLFHSTVQNVVDSIQGRGLLIDMHGNV
jgi:hypothetical protein